MSEEQEERETRALAGPGAADLDAPQDAGGFEARQRAENDRAARLAGLGGRLQKLFDEQVSERAGIEERWLEDLAQYNGQYDEETLSRIRAMGGSEAFVNFTRVKCNTVEAREAEMVLPTDDRNWSIEPTPVPELRKQARSTQPLRGPDGQAVMNGDGANPAPLTEADQAVALIKEAREKADAMQAQMDDQLTEAGFNAQQRMLIHHKVVMGTGILKGPVIQARIKRSYRQQPQLDENTGITVQVWAEDLSEDLQPGVEAVSPWDFFPDMRAITMDDCEFTFQRHRHNRQALEDLKKLPGFMGTQVDQAVAAGPAAALSGLFDQAASQDLRARRANSRFEVLEYHGPITREDLEAAGAAVPPELTSQMQGVVWMCNGMVLKATLSLLDGGESMYDVVPFERDDTCIFGFGLPYRMRHSQAAGNSSWRMILDNARLSVGPQYAYQKGKVKPENGDYRLSPMKGWEVTDPNMRVSDAFAVFAVTPNFRSMFDILTMVREFGDEETGMPQIAQGQQSPSITKTAEGMGILMNSANVVLRRLIKEYDDWITSRFIRRLYRWNMRYNENEAVKGDYCIKALGSTALLLMEQQSRGLMQLAQLAGSNPEFAQRTKWGELYRAMVKALRINAESLVMSEGEWEAEAQKHAQLAQQQMQMQQQLQEQSQQQSPQQPGQPLAPEIQVKLAQVELGKARLELQVRKDEAELQLRRMELQWQARRDEASDEIDRQRIDAAAQEARMHHEAAMAQAQASFQRVQSDHDVAVLKLVEQRRLSMEDARKQFGLQAMNIESRHQMFNAEMRHAEATGHGI